MQHISLSTLQNLLNQNNFLKTQRMQVNPDIVKIKEFLNYLKEFKIFKSFRKGIKKIKNQKVDRFIINEEKNFSKKKELLYVFSSNY